MQTHHKTKGKKPGRMTHKTEGKKPGLKDEGYEARGVMSFTLVVCQAWTCGTHGCLKYRRHCSQVTRTSDKRKFCKLTEELHTRRREQSAKHESMQRRLSTSRPPPRRHGGHVHPSHQMNNVGEFNKAMPNFKFSICRTFFGTPK